MSDKKHWIIEIVQGLALPADQYAVFGSGLLDVLGLKKAADIDLIVTKALFNMLACDADWVEYTFQDGGPGLRHRVHDIEVFYAADMPLCDRKGIERMVQRAITIEGVKFVRLEDILAWKRAHGREKDVRDAALIEAYMKERTS